MASKFKSLFLSIVLFPRFSLLSHRLFGGAGVRLHPKYFKSKLQYRRFFSLLHDIRFKYRLKKGLDFGCGTATPTVLGKWLGLQILGYDVAKSLNDKETAFRDIQQNLSTNGFWIKCSDANATDLLSEYAEAFDFVITAWSITKDYTCAGDEESVVGSRVRHLSQLLKEGGYWFVNGGDPDGRHYELIRDSLLSQSISKKINLVKF